VNGGVGTTAAVSLGTSSTAAVLHWLMQCYMAGAFLAPDESTLLILAGFIAPLAHAARDKLAALLGGDHA
jgi:hypothetical protein